ncbi:MAG: hypothetical protein N4A49_10870 [Marinifilaceae bacterium]|jgi:archaellin|nr:hypothetical protein [Marinifilaceae bacterium]
MDKLQEQNHSQSGTFQIINPSLSKPIHNDLNITIETTTLKNINLNSTMIGSNQRYAILGDSQESLERTLKYLQKYQTGLLFINSTPSWNQLYYLTKNTIIEIKGETPPVNNHLAQIKTKRIKPA